MSANNRPRHNEGATITRHSWASAGHEPRVIIKTRDHDFLRAPTELYSAVAQCSQNVLDTAQAQCSLGFLTNIFTARHYTLTPDLTFISPDTTEMSVRSIMTDFEVPFTPLGSFFLSSLSLFFPKWTKSGLEILWRFWQGHAHQICPIFRYQRESWSIFRLWLAERVTSEEIWPFMYRGMRANSPARTLRNATSPKAPL